MAGAPVLGQIPQTGIGPGPGRVHYWTGPDGETLPFNSLEEIEDFLRTAEIVEHQRVSEGINDIRRLLLQKDGIRMHAAFRDVSEFKPVVRLESGATVLNFRDDAAFECAAYELARLLGLDIVPPTVERKAFGTRGTLQAWIEDAVMAKDLPPAGSGPIDRWRRMMQRQVRLIFDKLIHNDDRNLGNVLYAADGRMALIDHTRAFRMRRDVGRTDGILFCERRLFDRLRRLDRETLRHALGDSLSGVLIDAVLKRRDQLVDHLEELIRRRGEKAVLFSFYEPSDRRPS